MASVQQQRREVRSCVVISRIDRRAEHQALENETRNYIISLSFRMLYNCQQHGPLSSGDFESKPSSSR